LTNDDTPQPIVIAIKVDDPGLADRLTALLLGVQGVRLAQADDTADIALVKLRTAGAPAEQDASLTPRELEVLSLLAEGASNKAIARRLGISVHTAKFHVGSLLDKLDASGRTDAVTHAARLGVIQL
jgi:DNA-binding CsgD family transcriptional regulator